MLAFKLTSFLTCVLILAPWTHAVDLQGLFSRMTVEDKCGQMTQIECYLYQNYYNPPLTSFDEKIFNIPKLTEALRDKHIGAIIAPPFDSPTARDWQKYINYVQSMVLNTTRLHIPVLYAIDSIHGTGSINESVLLPHALSQAASFNVEIARRVGEITGMEQRAIGVPWNFDPVLDMGRQPLWPRLYETYGEDTYLASKMGEAYIHGHQGDNPKDGKKSATCLKHYLGYGEPFNGHDRTNALIPDMQLREIFLPSFAKGVAAGALTVMLNSASVNGVPGHANSYYINDILKGELNFTGFVVSDWQDIIRLHTRDKMADTPEEAVRIAVMAGVDMSMVPTDFSFYDHCVKLAKKDVAFANRVDDASMRILRVKDKLGLFENPFADPQAVQNVGLTESRAFNLEAAHESIILAKNLNDILPLSTQNGGKKILVAGPSGNILRTLNGGWSHSWQGSEQALLTYGPKRLTIYQSISLTSPNAVFSEGSNFTDLTNLNETLAKAQTSDIIILCIGEDSYAETAGNINDLSISEPQQTLASALQGLGKPVIIVYLGGRPRLMTEIAEKANAVLIGFFPGERGAEAIADILFGRYNPNARLPITYPRYPSGYTTYDHLPIEAFDLNKYEYLFPFGHGLSYTKFEYSELKLSTKSLKAPNDLNVSVRVSNVGNLDGKEVVMLFVNDQFASVPRPLKQLKRFTKIQLAKSQSQVVNFTLTMDDLSFINVKSKKIYEPGTFNIYVDSLKESFELTV